MWKEKETKQEIIIEKQGFAPKEVKRQERELKYLQRSSEAKNFKSWLTSRIQLSVLNKDTETEFILKEVSKKYSEFEDKKKEEPVKIEIIDGWKSIDKLDFFNGFDRDFVVESHNKDKETGEVSTTSHEIKREWVNRILFYIKTWKINESHKCYDFAPILKFEDWKDLWRERKIYFNEYYFPIKILEKLLIIKYSGRGKVTRLK